MKIDIGGGLAPEPGFMNLDPVHGEGKWKRALGDGVMIPTSSGTVERVRASHVMEHIPAGRPRITVMNEVHRVLEPGGMFYIIVPLMVGTWHAIADPTHVSFWVPESFDYFDGTSGQQADYGILPWETLAFSIEDGWEGHWTGLVVK